MVARANALVWPRALRAPRFAVTVAAAFLIVETVLVVLLKQAEPGDPAGTVYAVLLGVALVGNFAAAVSAAVSAAADQRRGADSSSDLDRMASRTGDVESRHPLEQFFDLTSDLMVISDQGKLLKVNPAFEQALGYTVDDLAPAPFELVPPEDMHRLSEQLKDLTNGRGPVRFENRATTRDGSLRWIEWSVTPHQGLFYAVGRDVTAQRDEEEQLRETRHAA
jgi:PAS domain S-box-containing protein